MLSHNKKGQGGGMKWVIVSAIIVLIIIGLLFAYFNIFKQVSKNTVNRVACQNSVDLRAKSNVLGEPILKDLDCETVNLEINTEDEDVLYKQVAYEMYSCWDQFGEGKKDFLSDADFGNGNNWCFICSNFEFSEKTQENIPTMSMDELNNYLVSNTIPFSEDKNYYDYFYGDNFGEGSNFELDEINSEWSTDEEVYVVFFGDKRLDLWKDVTNIDKTEALGGAVGCLGGGKLGAAIGSFFSPVGSVIGGGIGCAAGSIIFAVTEQTTRKTEYVSALYVGNADDIKGICEQ